MKKIKNIFHSSRFFVIYSPGTPNSYEDKKYRHLNRYRMQKNRAKASYRCVTVLDKTADDDRHDKTLGIYRTDDDSSKGIDKMKDIAFDRECYKL